MTNNIKYSIEKQDGNILVRSTVKSFNLDHVTDKDITSYYRNVSNQALFDTGLLPLNGTGTLAIRSAGRHTQIAFQHAPALAYINWGANEGDPKAKAYLLAQPYRIWIADLLDGNLYGARMFYSPYPQFFLLQHQFFPAFPEKSNAVDELGLALSHILH